jgi:ribosome-binding protein aMBF1 (putative translation factor)
MFTFEQKAKAALREVNKRKQVYPGYVERHRMSQRKADYEIAIMIEIAADYERAVERARPKELL